jgi:hypothetical protein
LGGVGVGGDVPPPPVLVTYAQYRIPVPAAGIENQSAGFPGACDVLVASLTPEALRVYDTDTLPMKALPLSENPELDTGTPGGIVLL